MDKPCLHSNEETNSTIQKIPTLKPNYDDQPQAQLGTRPKRWSLCSSLVACCTPRRFKQQKFILPEAMTVDAQGNFFLFQSGRYQHVHHIRVYRSDGKFLRSFGHCGTKNGQFDKVTAMVIDHQGNLVLVDSGNHRAQIIDPTTGQCKTTFGSIGVAHDQFNQPYGVALTACGDLVISDCQNHRIHIWNSYGVWLSNFGSQGNQIGELQGPTHVAVDGFGNIIISDTGNRRVQVFSDCGKALRVFGKLGFGDPQFEDVGGITADKQGKIIIPSKHKIYVYSNEGRLLYRFGPQGGLSSFLCPVMLNDGRIAVADYNHHRIKIFG